MMKYILGFFLLSISSVSVLALGLEQEKLHQSCAFILSREITGADEDQVGSIQITMNARTEKLKAVIKVNERTQNFNTNIRRSYAEGDLAKNDEMIQDIASSSKENGGPDLSGYESILATLVAEQSDGSAAAVYSFFDKAGNVLGRVGTLGWLPVYCH